MSNFNPRLAAFLLCAAGITNAQNAQLPTWPQQFSVQGPEVSAFGFAVTQPGPVAIEVRWNGPPLRIALEGPNRVEQAGAGRVVLNYQVTPQDVQRDVLWTVSMRLQSPGPMPAAGQIIVQHPPADAALGQRAALARRAAFSRQQAEQANPLIDARVEQAIAARRAEFAQRLGQQDQAERQKTQMMVNQLRGAGISSRAVLSARPGVPTMGPQRDPGTAQLIREVAPQITALSQTSGGPRTALTITGTGFSTVQGRVYLSIPSAWVPPCMNCQPGDPDQARPANVMSWTDTAIVVELPDVVGVLRYQAEIFLHRGQMPSNRVPFDFIPRQDMRSIVTFPADRRHSTAVLTIPTSEIPKHTFSHWRLPVPFGEFVGEKGNDEFFLLTKLQNGWTMTNVDFFPPAEAIKVSGVGGGAGSEFSQAMSLLGGAYIQQQGSADHPYINVRWWINPFREYVPYRYAIHIVGPAGVPDGVVIP